MLKMALFDCAINKKCCSVDGGRGICPLFSSPPRGIWQLKSPHPPGICHPRQKNANARGSAGLRRNKPCYSCGWKRGWGWPRFDTNLPALLCKSSYSLVFFKNNSHNKAKKVCIKTRSPSASLPSKIMAHCLMHYWEESKYFVRTSYHKNTRLSPIAYNYRIFSVIRRSIFSNNNNNIFDMKISVPKQ